jgi:gliding motility associated protien GldN
MNKKHYHLIVLFSALVLLSVESLAQRGRGRSTPPAAASSGSQQPTNTTKKDTSKPTGTIGAAIQQPNATPGKRVYTIEELQGDGGNEYGAEVKQSRRPSYAYKTESINERKPLAYDDIREDDATYSQFVWREIDGREKMNLPFTAKAKEDNGDQRFFSILLNAIKKDSVMAFRDERFTDPLPLSEAIGLTSRYSPGLVDTSYEVNINDPNIKDTIIKPRENLNVPKSDSVFKFRIKEQWVFDKEVSRMVVRIIGIAPLYRKERDVQPSVAFWIYYPDLRPSLAKSFAYNPKNAGARMTWEEVFEGRFFSSYIIKSSFNNSKDKTLAQLIKDPLFQLLEGENIKEKLFNYEQDLWSY